LTGGCPLFDVGGPGCGSAVFVPEAGLGAGGVPGGVEGGSFVWVGDVRMGAGVSVAHAAAFLLVVVFVTVLVAGFVVWVADSSSVPGLPVGVAVVRARARTSRAR
jgi:hypothetical protein